MNRERFHNELAMRLGYERIMKDKRILISVEDSDDPWVTLKLQGYKDINYKASGKPEIVEFQVNPEIREAITEIVDAVHQAYIDANTSIF